MPDVILKDIPETLLRDIQQRAERNHRAVNDEIIAVCREAATHDEQEPDTQKILRRSMELQSEMRGALTDDVLAQARREGRP